MIRRSIIGILLVCSLSLLIVAQEIPIVSQPREAGYSPAQLSELDGAIKQLQRGLSNSNLGSQKELGTGGWTPEKLAAYTAGNLERLGYQVAIVSRQTQEGRTKIWVVVRADLGGAIAWIPVEPLPNGDIYQANLGDVPLIAALIYDSSYLLYDAVVELPSNIPPTAVIREPVSDIVEDDTSAWFGNGSVDPDGEIVLFQWTFGEDVQRMTPSISAWYTFDVGGIIYPITLTVTDSRGAQASTSTTLYVLTLEEEAAKSCGCN